MNLGYNYLYYHSKSFIFASGKNTNVLFFVCVQYRIKYSLSSKIPMPGFVWQKQIFNLYFFNYENKKNIIQHINRSCFNNINIPLYE